MDTTNLFPTVDPASYTPPALHGRKVVFGDEALTVCQWAKRLGMPKGVLYQRLLHMPAERALTMPYQNRKAKKGPSMSKELTLNLAERAALQRVEESLALAFRDLRAVLQTYASRTAGR